MYRYFFFLMGYKYKDIIYLFIDLFVNRGEEFWCLY